MVEGAYFVQRQTLSMDAFWISFPLGVLVALVLLANNIRDTMNDEKRGIKTLAVIAGRRKGTWIYVMMVEFAYLSIILMALAGPLNLWSLMVLISLPLCFNLLREVIKDMPIDADARTAKLNTVFGVLLLLSLIIERLT